MSNELLQRCEAMIRLVEGFPAHEWRSAAGRRIKDTDAWVKFYVTVNAAIAAEAARPVHAVDGLRGLPGIATELRAVLCDPSGEVVIDGSQGDRDQIQRCLDRLDTLALATPTQPDPQGGMKVRPMWEVEYHDDPEHGAATGWMLRENYIDPNGVEGAALLPISKLVSAYVASKEQHAQIVDDNNEILRLRSRDKELDNLVNELQRLAATAGKEGRV